MNMQEFRDQSAIAGQPGGALNESSPPRMVHERAPLSAQVKRELRGCAAAHGSPLLLADCEQVRRQFRQLSAALPNVELHYAMKALPHPAIISVLSSEGCSFDVASKGEIDVLRSVGVHSRRTLHTHPIKRDQDIQDGLSYGCRTFVVDNPAEIAKFVAYRDVASVLLRIGFRGTDAGIDLAKKFGCAPEEAFGLLEFGRALNVKIEGLTFHVGSQCSSSRSHVDAIEGCLRLIERARAAGLPPIRILDIGGGFPVPYQLAVPDIETFCAPIRTALRRVPLDVRLIAEPGRYLVAPAVQGLSTIIGKARRHGKPWYYVDDGVFGSYNGLVYDCIRYPIRALSENAGPVQASVLAGPTCDSIDIIAEDILLPELDIGEIIVADSMGAYTAASASDFNLIPRATMVVVDRSGSTESSRFARQAAVETCETL